MKKKKKVAKQRKVKQSASGKRSDKRIKAKKPGWRKSKSGTKYFENRSNRSDKDLRKRI